MSPEEISKEAASYVGGKLVDWGFDAFRKVVVERLSKRRAEEFFRAFAKATADPKSATNDFRERLNSMMENERDSETLFEAYRAVCLSRSKTLGPRCIALLTARIVSEKRAATPKEEQWGQAYEMLSDVELGEIWRYYTEKFRLARNSDAEHILKDGLLTIIWYTDSIAQGTEIIQSPLNLFDVLGSWGPKIQQLGMIETVASQTVFKPRKGSANPFDDDDRPYYSVKESILLHEADLPYVDLILTGVELMD